MPVHILKCSLIAAGLIFLNTISLAQNVALNFDGTDDYVQTSYSGISGKAARTVEAWIRTTANCDPNNGGKQKVIVDWGSTATGGRFTLNLLWSSAPRIEIGGSGLNSTTSVNDGKWHHLAVVYDPSATNNYRLLIDGKLDLSGNITTTINTASSVNLRIGCRVDGVNTFDGDIDEVRVFNYARTDSAIAADMVKELCSLPSGLVAYYKLNEGNPSSNNSSKNKATDYASGGYTGDLLNFALSSSGSNWVNGDTLQGGDSRATIDTFVCSSMTSPSGNQTWIFPGTYYDTIVNASKCDSFMIFKLSIGKKSIAKNVNACDSFVSDGGKVYTTSGSYTETYTTTKGCDSVIRYVVAIKNSVTHNENVSICDSFVTPKGNTHYSSGIYPETYAASNGCDSVVNYNVKINLPAFTNDSISTCDSALVDAKWHFKSDVISIKKTTSLGCDSTHIIKLNIRNSHLIKTDITECDSFTSSGGVKYLSSGEYREMFTNNVGCDSVRVYQITLNKSVEVDRDIQACDSVELHGNWYFSSNKFTQSLTTQNGCDSLVNYDVNIVSINPNVTQNGDELTAVEKDADTYKWVDCSTGKNVPDANSVVYKSRYNGDFKVVMSKDDCSLTSDCYTITTASVGFNQHPLTRVTISPNPNNGNFLFYFLTNGVSGTYVIYDALGATVDNGEFKNGVKTINHEYFENGVYFIHFETNSGQSTRSFIVQK